MGSQREWSEMEDKFLRENFHLTNQALAAQLNVAEQSIKNRYAQLGLDRPKGKNNLARARNLIYRERARGIAPDDWHSLPSTRSDAKAEKSSFYWDGKLCERAQHLSKRKTSSGGCWECEYADHKLKLQIDSNFSVKRAESGRRYYQENREEYLSQQRQKKKSPESREWYRTYERRRRQEDIEWRLAKSLRDRLYKAVKRSSKSASAISLIGCSIEHLKNHLENQFSPPMSWENYGQWHIDHIRPCISFDLTEPEQQKICFHYTNLQPMWGEDNRAKGGIWDGIDPRAGPRRDPAQMDAQDTSPLAAKEKS